MRGEVRSKHRVRRAALLRSGFCRGYPSIHTRPRDQKCVYSNLRLRAVLADLGGKGERVTKARSARSFAASCALGVYGLYSSRSAAGKSIRPRDLRPGPEPNRRRNEHAPQVPTTIFSKWRSRVSAGPFAFRLRVFGAVALSFIIAK